MLIWIIAFISGLLLAVYKPYLIPYESGEILSVLFLFLWVFLRCCSLNVWLKQGLTGLVILGLGYCWATHQANTLTSWTLPPEAQRQDRTIMGTVVSIPQERSRSVEFMFKVERFEHVLLEEQPLVMLNWYEGREELVPGDRWIFRVRLRQPHGLVNPGGRDNEAYWFREGIRAIGYVRSKPNPLSLGQDPYYSRLTRFRYRLRELLLAYRDELPLAGVIAALTLGDKSAIHASEWDTMRSTGTAHLMAISGLHVGLVCAVVFTLAFYFWGWIPAASRIMTSTQAAAGITVIAALSYSCLAGLSLPTQRACIMISTLMFGLILKRKMASWNTLALAGILVLIWDPLAIVSAGFWLSFIAVFFILYGMKGRLKPHKGVREWGRVQWLISLGLMPISLFYFGQYALIGPVANLIAIPWVSMAVVPPSLMAVMLLPIWPGLGEVCLYLAHVSLSTLWGLLNGLAEWQGGLWEPLQPSVWQMLIACLGGLLILAPKGLYGRATGWICFLPLIYTTPKAPNEGELWLTVLDVGQGLSVVMQTHQHTLVYDTGTYLGARDALLPYLKHRGVGLIDKLIISHADYDHVGGAELLNQHYSIKQVLSGTPDDIHWRDTDLCKSGQLWHWEGVQFKILYPNALEPVPKKRNNASCVLQISVGNNNILIPGDIEKTVEQRLVEAYGRRLGSNILLAPHHGSKTSSTEAFIQAVKPDTVIVSAGYMNPFNHPNQKVIERYQIINSRLINTAHSGAVTLKIAASSGAMTQGHYREESKRFWRHRVE